MADGSGTGAAAICADRERLLAAAPGLSEAVAELRAFCCSGSAGTWWVLEWQALVGLPAPGGTSTS